MTKVQQWLDQNYPKIQRKNIRELHISSKNLTDSLLVSDWSQLEEVSCCNNQLSSLKITNCPKLKTIWAYNNQLTEASINNCPEIKTLEVQNNQLTSFEFLNDLKLENLTWLKFGNNKFPQQDLSFFNQFSDKMVNLWLLGISSSPFAGSLKPLHSFEKLTELEIDGTNLTGLEYLPESCRKIYGDNSPVAESLQRYMNPWNGSYFFQGWRQENQFLIAKTQLEIDKESQIKKLIKDLAEKENLQEEKIDLKTKYERLLEKADQCQELIKCLESKKKELDELKNSLSSNNQQKVLIKILLKSQENIIRDNDVDSYENKKEITECLKEEFPQVDNLCQFQTEITKINQQLEKIKQEVNLIVEELIESTEGQFFRKGNRHFSVLFDDINLIEIRNKFIRNKLSSGVNLQFNKLSLVNQIEQPIK